MQALPRTPSSWLRSRTRTGYSSSNLVPPSNEPRRPGAGGFCLLEAGKNVFSWTLGTDRPIPGVRSQYRGYLRPDRDRFCHHLQCHRDHQFCPGRIRDARGMLTVFSLNTLHLPLPLPLSWLLALRHWPVCCSKSWRSGRSKNLPPGTGDHHHRGSILIRGISMLIWERHPRRSPLHQQ